MEKAIIHNFEELDYPGTEAMNTMCSNLSFAGRKLKKIVLTSCTANNGKSFTSMYIMKNLAKRGRKVLLIDADLRKSYLIKKYQIEIKGEVKGLAHYLTGHCDIQDIIYETNIDGAYIIPIGRDAANPIPLIDSPYFSELLDKMSEQFDTILIDAPPVGLVVDAAEIAKNCDGVVFVVEYNKTRRRELADAKRQIEQTGCPILGCVVNMVTFNTLSAKKYYNKSYYTHYNSGYYRKSDNTDEKTDNAK